MLDKDIIEFLIKLGQGIRANPILFARAVFPDRPKGYVAAARDIGNYAVNLGIALNLEDLGDPHAEKYHRICERILGDLTAFVKGD